MAGRIPCHEVPKKHKTDACTVPCMVHMPENALNCVELSLLALLLTLPAPWPDEPTNWCHPPWMNETSGGAEHPDCLTT